MGPRNMGRCAAGGGSVQTPPEIGEMGGETLYVLRRATFLSDGRVITFILMHLNALIAESRKEVGQEMFTYSVLRLHLSWFLEADMYGRLSTHGIMRTMPNTVQQRGCAYGTAAGGVLFEAFKANDLRRTLQSPFLVLFLSIHSCSSSRYESLCAYHPVSDDHPNSLPPFPTFSPLQGT